MSIEREASLRGAAIMAFERLGVDVLESDRSGVDGDVVEPDPDRAAAFAHLRVD